MRDCQPVVLSLASGRHRGHAGFMMLPWAKRKFHGLAFLPSPSVHNETMFNGGAAVFFGLPSPIESRKSLINTLKYVSAEGLAAKAGDELELTPAARHVRSKCISGIDSNAAFG